MVERLQHGQQSIREARVVVLFCLVILVLKQPSFRELATFSEESQPPAAITAAAIREEEEKSLNDNGNNITNVTDFPMLLPPVEDGNPSVAQFVTKQIGNTSGSLLNSSCHVTTQVRIEQREGRWFLQSMDEHGQDKRVGGDEFYVSYKDQNANQSAILSDQMTNQSSKYHEHASLVAVVTDLDNGRYSLEFVTTPMDPNPVLTGRGELNVVFQYTCGIGFVGSEFKKDWLSSGSTRTQYRCDVVEPPFRAFQPPSGIDLSQYNKVIAFGDSLMLQFAQPEKYKDRFVIPPNVGLQLGKNTLPVFLKKMSNKLGKELEQPNVALVVGSAVWDTIQGHYYDTYFADHLEAVRLYIQELRKRYPNVPIYWKSASALHVHRVGRNCYYRARCNRRVRYMSSSRMRYLYDQQKRIMQELNVPLLDVYEAFLLSADWTLPNDGRHFVPALNSVVTGWFFQESNALSPIFSADIDVSM